MAASRNVEDVYGLSPVQEGMLFHALQAPESAVYVSQVSCVFSGLAVEPFQRAWQSVVDRHPALRTAFAWRSTTRPLQVVARRIALAWHCEDWRRMAQDEREAAVERYLEEDRRRGFDLAKPPLQRLSLLRLDDDRHRFVWTHHHLLVDGWSVSRVIGEVLTVYTALLAGREPERPRPRPYRAFIEWLERRRGENAERYWRRALAGADVPTPLPDGGLRAGRGLAEIRSRLTAEATAALERLAREERVTLNTVAQGAFALCLARASGRREVVFGSVTSGRPPDLPGSGEIVGVFINTLPVRVAVEPGAPAADWLRALQSEQSEAREHESCSLTEIQGWSGIDRRTPLFESILVFENYPLTGSAAAAGSTLTVSDPRTAEASNYPLAVVVVPGGRLAIKISHDRSRVPATAARRLLGALTATLEAVAASPRRPLGDLPPPSAAERHQIRHEWNDSARVWRGARLLHEAVLEAAGRKPDEVAAVSGARSATFGELDRRSAALAARLRGLGVGPDVAVAVSGRRSLDSLIAMLAVLRAGGAYLPCDPEWPASRGRFAVQQSGARLVLADRELRDRLGAVAAPVLALEEALAGPAPADPPAPAPEPHPDHLAYVLYTSGSTGRPKGVMVSHRGAVNYLRWAAEAYEAAAGDGAPVHSSLSFDLTVTALWVPLSAGRPVDLLPHDGSLEALAEAVGGGRRWSLVKLTPAHLEALSHLGDGAHVAGARALVLGGEALRGEALASWRRDAPGLRVFNEYGPTETVVGCAVHEVGPGVPEPGPVAIGRPIANTRLYVTGPDLRPVSRGAAGELLVGGDGVSRGYLGLPALTALRYVPDPFGGDPGGRLYRTGDRVRHRPDGELEYLGRLDRQLKLRGTRIEPDEIEAVLGAHPEVRRCRVLPHPAGDRLVAYVVAEKGAGAAAETLAAHAAERLPRAMVPASFVLLERLPLTPLGKVDDAALPPPEAPAAGRKGGALLTPLEETLCGLWSDLIGAEVATRDADFFALGGHSLLALRLISRLRACFGVELPLRTLFDHPTVAELATAVGAALARRGGEPPPAPPPIERVARDRSLPLSPVQLRLWRAQHLAPESSDYNVPQAVRLSGGLAEAALAATVAEVTRRHEALRTAFPRVEGEPVQRIEPPRPPAPLPVVDLSGLPPEVRPTALRELVALEARRVFRLDAGAPLRVSLFRLDAGEHALVFVAHHLVCDAWSMGLIVAEVGELYGAATEGRPFPGSAPELQLADVAAWHHGWLTESGELDRQLDYWRGRLAGCPPELALPLDRPRSTARRARGAKVSVRLDGEAAGRLTRLAREAGATLFMTLLALYQVLLSRISGQTDLAVGVPVAGRSRRELENVVGFFVNTLVLRTDLGDDPPLRRLIPRVRDAALEAFAHQDVPFDLLVERLDPERRPGCGAFFQASFMLLAARERGLRLPDLEVSDLEIDVGRLRTDLQLQLLEVPDGLVGAFHYDASLFDAETVEDLARRFTALVGAAVADPEAPVSTLPLLDAGEGAALYAGFAGSLEGA